MSRQILLCVETNKTARTDYKYIDATIKRFYIRPLYILKMLSRIRSFAEIRNYFVAGMNVLLRK